MPYGTEDRSRQCRSAGRYGLITPSIPMRQRGQAFLILRIGSTKTDWFSPELPIGFSDFAVNLPELALYNSVGIYYTLMPLYAEKRKYLQIPLVIYWKFCYNIYVQMNNNTRSAERIYCKYIIITGGKDFVTTQ